MGARCAAPCARPQRTAVRMTEAIADLPLGAVTASLLRLRETSFGTRIRSHVDCTRCGERLELTALVVRIAAAGGRRPARGRGRWTARARALPARPGGRRARTRCRTRNARVTLALRVECDGCECRPGGVARRCRARGRGRARSYRPERRLHVRRAGPKARSSRSAPRATYLAMVAA